MAQTNLLPWTTNLTVGTTAIMAALPANPTRKGLIIANNAPLSGTPPAGPSINVTFGGGTALGTSQGTVIIPPPPPTATTGIEIAAGTSFILPPAQAPNVALGAQLNMIASAAATPVSVLEL